MNEKAQPTMLVEQVAIVCHELNRAYCSLLGDDSQVAWEEAPDWQKKSAINGVNFHLHNPDATVSGSHENWLKEKLADGWKYSPLKDAEKKEHPCCLPYDDLPVEQQIKDNLFKAIVKIFAYRAAILSKPIVCKKEEKATITGSITGNDPKEEKAA